MTAGPLGLRDLRRWQRDLLGRYQNGQSNAIFQVDPNPLWIGADYNQNTFNGAIDDFQLFGTVLTRRRSQQLVLEQRPRSAPAAGHPPVQIAAGACLDLGGISQTVASLSDTAPGRGHGDQ